MNYVKNNDKAPLIIYGKPGSGKSALMAKALERLEEVERELKEFKEKSFKKS